MKRAAQILTAIGLLLGLAPASAGAEFGLSDYDVTFANQDGSPAMQAGSHPFEMTTHFRVNSVIDEGVERVDGAVRNIDFAQPPGFAGNPSTTPRCTKLDFLQAGSSTGTEGCSNSTVVGLVKVSLLSGIGIPGGYFGPVYNLEPAPGVAMRLGFWIANVPVIIENVLNPEAPHNVIAKVVNISQLAELLVSDLTLWGNPADPAHDAERGTCISQIGGSHFTGKKCPAANAVKPFIVMPRSCEGPLLSTFEALSWWSGDPENPGPPTTDSGFALTHDDSIPPNPLGTTGCSKVGFAPRLAAKPTTDNAESPMGIEVSLEIDDEGIANPSGIAQSDLKKAVVTLPKGVTANPSLAEGLAVCSPEDLARESLQSEPGEGCPEASKIGTVESESPLLEGELVKGALFMAEPYNNPFDSLLALYIVIKHPKQGIFVKLAGRVAPDPETGQLITTFGDPSSKDPAFRSIPQLPISDFRLRFREGGRSPLISPPACGTYETTSVLTPWANPGSPLSTVSTFQITRGVGGGACPSGGVPPFNPEFSAGSINNNAGSHSPFYMRLIRHDGEQDMTKFSSVLPPGVVGRLAGVAKCPDAAIAAARTKDGRAELAAPSCPLNSRIGRTLAGAGVGSQLTYVPGQIYLSGPYRGAPLSVVAITPAVAGPFDAGTVVVRQALRIDPLTAEVKVDGDSSDPIPHILQGIPLKVRDLRVYVDRPNFTLNPTSCEPSQASATLFGSFLDVFSAADDRPVSLGSRYQAANCANLGFRPKLSLALKGGTRRGGHPALIGTYRPRSQDANMSRMVLTLPRSAFLDQAHIRTICTRVQFAAASCPPGAAYGKATAWTPLLEEPLSGPVYLRSSDNKLPDFVADLHGLVDVEAVARIDSKGGGIRATFPLIPDAPLTKVVVHMQGARKGLIVNSRNLCAGRSRADARMGGHNGKRHRSRPVVKALGCGGKKGRKG
jgi:hypothetical protein